MLTQYDLCKFPWVTKRTKFQYKTPEPFLFGAVPFFCILLCAGFSLAKTAKNSQIHPKILRTFQNISKLYKSFIHFILILEQTSAISQNPLVETDRATLLSFTVWPPKKRGSRFPQC